MGRVKLKKGQRIGGVAYPTINAILSGMELLGGLLQTTTFSTSSSDGNTYFLNYWNNYLSKQNPKYAPYGSIFRKLVRHGIAHTYLTKTGIWILKGNSSEHLKIYTSGGNRYMIIDIGEFFKDFIASYQALVRPIVYGGIVGASVTPQDMLNRLNEMIRAYETESNSELSTIGTPTPMPPTMLRVMLGNASGVAAGTVTTYSAITNRQP